MKFGLVSSKHPWFNGFVALSHAQNSIKSLIFLNEELKETVSLLVDLACCFDKPPGLHCEKSNLLWMSHKNMNGSFEQSDISGKLMWFTRLQGTDRNKCLGGKC